MLAVRGPRAVASLFHHRLWTDSFHTWTISTKYNRCFRLVLSTARSAVVPLSHVRPSSSLTSLLRRKKAVRVRVASSTAPSFPEDTRKSLEVSAYPFFIVAGKVVCRSYGTIGNACILYIGIALSKKDIGKIFISQIFFGKICWKAYIWYFASFFTLKRETTFV